MCDRAKGKILVLIALSSLLWLLENAEAEETATLPTLPVFPTTEAVTLNLPLSPPLPLGEESFTEPSFPEEVSFEEIFRLPEGREVSEYSLRSRFVLGRRVDPQIFRPETTFRLSSQGGLGDYLNEEKGNSRSVSVDPELLFEEQIVWGFQTAEATIEFFDSAAMPLMGGVISGLTQVGQTLHQMDKRLKKRHLHLQYLDGKPAASYRVKF